MTITAKHSEGARPRTKFGVTDSVGKAKENLKQKKKLVALKPVKERMEKRLIRLEGPGGKTVFAFLFEVLNVEANDHHLYINIARNGVLKLCIRKTTFDEFIKLFAPGFMYRIHRSLAVNLFHLSGYDEEENTLEFDLLHVVKLHHHFDAERFDKLGK